MNDRLNRRRYFLKTTIALSTTALTPQIFNAMPCLNEYTNNKGDGFTFLSRAILLRMATEAVTMIGIM